MDDRRKRRPGDDPAPSVAPRPRLESAIAHLWQEFLRVEHIDVEDDFFRLGGESLAAVQMLSAVEDVLGAPVSFSDFVEAPTVAGLAAAVERTRQRSSTHEPAPLERGPTSGRAPCAFAQERLWFVEEMTEGIGVYNLPFGMRIRSSLDVEALEQSLREIVRRHAALRTTFIVEDGRPAQVFASEADVPLEKNDLRHSANPDAEARQIADGFAGLPFNLETGPLMRAQLLRLGDDDHVFQLVFHHIICDGWSIVVILRELGELYRAYARSEEPHLPEPVQFPDYARQQRSSLEGPVLDQKIARWRERLGDIPAALELPTDHPRPPIPSYRGRTRRSRLSRATTTAIRSFSREEGATPFSTLLAVFDVLLFRYSGQETIVVGSTAAARDRPELEGGVGLFASTVVLRCDLSGEPTFRGLLGHVRETVLDAVAHQDAPFERLVAELRPEREVSYHPLFQVFFAQVPYVPLDFEGAELFDANPPTSRFDLTLWVEEKAADALELVWEYSTDLFDDETIARLERHFLRLLDGVLADPEQRITELPLLTKSERNQLLGQWEQPHVDYPIACLHELFEARVRCAPNAPAVSYEGEWLTYRALNERANQLAHRLRELGVGPETLVALCLERSLELVIAVLATLKAGGAYVPIDPDYPADRISFVLADTEARVLLTQERLASRLPAHEATVVCLDRDASALADRSNVDPEPVAQPENLAYVIYTSGSTGQPKGVQVEHRQVARLFTATEELFAFGPADAWILLHSYAFDFSVWELWGALLYGGRLVVAPLWTTRSPQALATMLVEERVTVLNVTPSLFVTALDDLLRVREGFALRFVVFGGEALQPAALRRWFERFATDGPQLVNMYGITETTVHVTYRLLSAADCDRDVSPIGRPLPDLRSYVLDAYLHPVPVSAPGELYVGGAGVARGYLNRPELTTERFVSNPFGAGRLYRTGDSVRSLPDGEIEFLGRIDDQVKIRGFRIELGEIQAVLTEHPAIAESAVVAVKTAADIRLAAYLVIAPLPSSVAPERVRSEVLAHLQKKLPSFMVPASITLIDELPLTANGKLDRKALPIPDWQEQSEVGFIAPQTPIEERIAAIWEEILGVERVGRDDNFFHLGGHSLLAARVVTQVRERFAMDLSVRALFEQPTLAAFANRIAAAGAEREPAAGKEPGSATQRPLYPLSFPQQQLLFLGELAPEAGIYNAALAVHVSGALDTRALERAVATVIERHEALRTVLPWEADGPKQLVLDRWTFALPVIDLTVFPAGEGEVELQRLLREEARRPFDLGRDLMLRATLFCIGEDENVILFQPHHISLDGWSVGVFFREVGELYQATLEGRSPRLAELSLQYRDFALWQRDRLRGERLDQELAYWRTQLAGAPTVLSLPTDRPRPPRQTFEGANHTIAMAQEVAEGVMRICRADGVTPYMLLLAAFGTLLYRLTGQNDILVGGPFANRGRAEFEQLIGFFANTLVMRVRMAGNPSFRELLTRVRETAIEAYEHQEVPFEYVVDATRPERDIGVNPLFQVNFRVRVDKPPALELIGTRTTSLPVDVGFARFDLALELEVLENGIAAEFIYNTDLFDLGSIERIAVDFETLLRQIIERPDTPLLGLDLPGDRGTETNGPATRGSAIRRFRQTKEATLVFDRPPPDRNREDEAGER